MAKFSKKGTSSAGAWGYGRESDLHHASRGKGNPAAGPHEGKKKVRGWGGGVIAEKSHYSKVGKNERKLKTKSMKGVKHVNKRIHRVDLPVYTPSEKHGIKMRDKKRTGAKAVMTGKKGGKFVVVNGKKHYLGKKRG